MGFFFRDPLCFIMVGEDPGVRYFWGFGGFGIGMLGRRIHPGSGPIYIRGYFVSRLISVGIDPMQDPYGFF